jgi:hypothetical protein
MMYESLGTFSCRAFSIITTGYSSQLDTHHNWILINWILITTGYSSQLDTHGSFLTCSFPLQATQAAVTAAGAAAGLPYGLAPVSNAAAPDKLRVLLSATGKNQVELDAACLIHSVQSVLMLNMQEQLHFLSSLVLPPCVILWWCTQG